MFFFYPFLGVLVLVYFYLKRIRRDLPPGPTPIPLIGNAHQFIFAKLKGKSNVELMSEWKKEFGSVYTIWLGPLAVVLICDYQTTVDSFVKNGDAHSGRIALFAMVKVREGFMGVIMNEGSEWQEQRRFALHTLRNFGVGRNIMQQRIMEEAEHRFRILDKQIEDQADGKVTMNPAMFFDLLVGSIINKMLAGYRYDENNAEEFFSLKHALDTAIDKVTPFDMVIFNEFTHQLPLFSKRWNTITKPMIDIRLLMKKQIKDRLAQVSSGQRVLDLTSDGDDFIDAYLIEMEKRKQNGQDLASFSTDMLTTNLFDLWGAGMETTISTLLWAFIFFLNHPEVPEKARKELVTVTGGARHVELSDKTALPYINAVITEVLRCSSILNFNMLHRTNIDTIVGCYKIPKGTVISSQQSVILADEQNFPEPEKFNPDRYFENNNAEKQVISFGLGKRSCLGESLARAELFLIISNFFQRYRISVPAGCPPPSMQQLDIGGFAKRVIPYEMTVEKVGDLH